jgi:hypothetical protein
MGSAYYDLVLSITEEYLGPAARRFVDRQITKHLSKPPELLTREDIPALAVRIRSGLMVLTQNEEVVQEAFRRLTAIADENIVADVQ